ncbi:MAG: tyrosine-type recombinase/integrase [Comamonas sp.]|uniref:tyrosine-type recombinase/integrase n=1 Tax=Comamonas sp. TaxID=34028 RepID=UPI003D0A36E6
MPYAALPDFYQRLCSVKGQSARALQMLILTSRRSGELRGICWGELDLSAGLRLVPAERMKSKRLHRVPLPAQAQALLSQLKPGEADDLVFVSNRDGMRSDISLTAVMRGTFQWPCRTASAPHSTIGLGNAEKSNEISLESVKISRTSLITSAIALIIAICALVLPYFNKWISCLKQ